MNMIGARHGCPDLGRSSLQRGEGGAPSQQTQTLSAACRVTIARGLCKLRIMTSIAAPQDDDTLFSGERARKRSSLLSGLGHIINVDSNKAVWTPAQFLPQKSAETRQVGPRFQLLRASHRSSKSGLVSIALCLGRQHQLRSLRSLRRYPFNPRASVFAISNSASYRIVPNGKKASILCH
jgi:hypothetical protein